MSQETENELSKYLKDAKSFQSLFLAFFDSDDENCFLNLQKYFDENKILENKQKFITNLCFISDFSNNYHRSENFMSKLEKTFEYLQPSFKFCTNIEIFKIFKENKLVLHLLFNKKIITLDEEIKTIITTDQFKKRNYPEYFKQEKETEETEESKEKEEKRKIGENDNMICSLIRKDDVIEFVKYTNQINFNLSSTISPSIYETNSFLIDKTPTIIEYASFYGSIQIIRYLIFNKVSVPETLWLYSVHSKNYELIHLLEENNVQPPNNSYKEVLFESIKCHHNEIADYIINNKFTNNQEEEFKNSYSLESVKYHNYFYIPNDYEFITKNASFIVCMTIGRYYELINIIFHMQVGPGILCSCIEGPIGDDVKYTLYCAVENEDIEMIKILMSTETYNSYGQSKTYKKTIIDPEYNFYENTDNKTALFLAVENKYYDIVKLLLSSEKGVNINSESELNCNRESYLEKYKDKYTKYPIHAALENNDDKMLEILLSSKEIDVNIEYKFVRNLEKPYEYNLDQIEKKTPLQIAVEKENVNAVRQLLSKETIDINKMSSYKLDKRLDGFEYDEDNQGNEEEELPGDKERDKQIRSKKTALHLAVEKNNIEIVKLLLNHSKIDINIREKYQMNKPLLKIDTHKTSLQIAIEKKEIEIVKLLLAQPSISINEKIPYRYDKEAKTHQDYYEENEENQENPENVENTPSKEENTERHENCLKTPLHVAVQTGCIEIIKLLLEQKSINTEIEDGQGRLPKDYTNNDEIKSLFK